MNSIPTHDQSIALSDSGQALVLALLHSHRESLETHFKHKSGGRSRVTRVPRLSSIGTFDLAIKRGSFGLQRIARF
jgi:hypothetical protein